MILKTLFAEKSGKISALRKTDGLEESYLMISPDEIREKFGDDFFVDDHTFKLGIDHRFTKHFSERFQNRKVLETCTGAGFTTIALARAASHVVTVDINPSHQMQAKENIFRAGLTDRVTFLSGDVLDEKILGELDTVDAAFLDPDWADTDHDHEYCFINSNTLPPADMLFERIYQITKNIALVLPPYITTKEFEQLPVHECESLYLGGGHELFCLYFGELVSSIGESEFHINGIENKMSVNIISAGGNTCENV